MKSKRKFRGRRPKPRDPFWIKFWKWVTPRNRENFYRTYYDNRKKGLPTTEWFLEYPIFNWSRELSDQLVEYFRKRDNNKPTGTERGE